MHHAVPSPIHRANQSKPALLVCKADWSCFQLPREAGNAGCSESPVTRQYIPCNSCGAVLIYTYWWLWPIWVIKKLDGLGQSISSIPGSSCHLLANPLDEVFHESGGKRGSIHLNPGVHSYSALPVTTQSAQLNFPQQVLHQGFPTGA